MDIETARELDRVLDLLRGRQKTFLTDAKLTELKLSHEPKDYLEELRKLNYISYDYDANGPTERLNAYYDITLHGKAFIGFEKKLKQDRNDKIRPTIVGVASAVLGSVIGALITVWTQPGQLPPQSYNIVLPKVYLINDKKSQTTNLKSDTTLVKDVAR